MANTGEATVSGAGLVGGPGDRIVQAEDGTLRLEPMVDVSGTEGVSLEQIDCTTIRTNGTVKIGPEFNGRTLSHEDIVRIAREQGVLVEDT